MQKIDWGLSSYVQYSNNWNKEINEMRENSESNLKKVFKKTTKKAEKIGVQLIIPWRIKYIVVNMKTTKKHIIVNPFYSLFRSLFESIKLKIS